MRSCALQEVETEGGGLRPLAGVKRDVYSPQRAVPFRPIRRLESHDIYIAFDAAFARLLRDLKATEARPAS